MRLNWLKLYRYSHVVRYQAYAGLRNEVARTYIGVLWWLLEPTLNALTMYVVFSVILTNRPPNFLPFLLVGTFSWQWFSASLLSAGNSIIVKSGMLQQVYIPKIVLPIVSTLNSTWKFLFAFAILILFVSLSHAGPGWPYFALPLVILIQFLLNLAIGMPLAALIPYFRDGLPVISAILTLLGFVSGIFFAPDQVDEKYRLAMQLNPMTIVMTAYRDIMLNNSWPNWNPLLGVAAVALLLLLGGIILLDRLDLSLPKAAT